MYDYETIRQRMGNGYNYWTNKETFMQVNVRTGDIRLDIWRGRNPAAGKRTVSVEEFNKGLIEDAPLCGLTGTQLGLVHVSILPLRHNQFNYSLQTLEFTTLSHPKSKMRNSMHMAFLPVYTSPAQIRSDILHGRTLGGAVDRRYGIAVDAEGQVRLFFHDYAVGSVDLKNRTVAIDKVDWSYFKDAQSLLEDTFKVTTKAA